MTRSSVNDNSPAVEFFVTEDCNGCGLCKNMAPELFQCVEYAYSYFLTRQPNSEKEVDLLNDIVDLCPVDALHQVGRTDN